MMHPDDDYEDMRERHWEGEVHRSRVRPRRDEFSIERHIEELHERTIWIDLTDLLRQMTLVSLDQAHELREMVNDDG